MEIYKYEAENILAGMSAEFYSDSRRVPISCKWRISDFKKKKYSTKQLQSQTLFSLHREFLLSP